MADKFYSPLLEVMATKYSLGDFRYVINRFKEPSETNVFLIKEVNSCYFFLLAEANLMEDFGTLNPDAVFTFFNQRKESGRRYLKEIVWSNLAECGYESKIEMAVHRLKTMIFTKTFFRERALGVLELCPF